MLPLLRNSDVGMVLSRLFQANLKCGNAALTLHRIVFISFQIVFQVGLKSDNAHLAVKYRCEYGAIKSISGEPEMSQRRPNSKS